MPLPSQHEAAFAALLVELRPTLFRRALRLVGHAADAEDLTQDTIERALAAQHDRFEPNTNTLAWVTRIMTNLAIDRWRRAARAPIARASEDEADLATSEPEAPPWTDVTEDDVRVAAAALPPPFRAVFELHYERGLPYEQIAAQLGVPLRTIGSRLHRARVRLRTVLQPVAQEQQGRAKHL